MNIVDIEGPSLDSFRDAVLHLAEQIEARRGWLTRTDRWPYHAPTDTGRAVLADSERVR